MRPKGYCSLGFARLDTDRQKRRGFPEVIYAPGKTTHQLKTIARRIIRAGQTLLITRIEEKSFVLLKESFSKLEYNPQAKLAYLQAKKSLPAQGLVVVVSAGTSDIPVAEEAACVLEIMGNSVARLYDVGVAGMHRLMDKKNLLRKARVIVAVAGMEGALPSVISGMVAAPVIAVPTSVGYGANLKGLSALLTMLNSCSPGIAVVNIDNGFGAGYMAGMINRV